MTQSHRFRSHAAPAKPAAPARDDAIYLARPPLRSLGQRTKERSGDFVVAALGLTLGLVCALFPWYIFFNQEKFGIRAMSFRGGAQVSAPTELVYQPQLIGAPFSTGEVPRMDLDFLPTGTLPDDPEARRVFSQQDQPFPSDLVHFRLVHVANGRAMIEDADGLWVVQPGSRLPDASYVSRIEQREGRWVLVTTLDRVVGIDN